ncbi:MAG: hypothetical protein KKI08_06135, partial [Armatimonadetes bacterium]|nr:hypothetical protein [Armatimonadota bacterium]
VLQGGTPVAGNPFAMSLSGAPSYATGAVFATDVALPTGRDYRYWFTAGDTNAPATGAPTTPQSGPVVNTAPTLTFSPEAGHGNDGVSPDTAAVGSLFVFRCIYKDADGDEPTAVRCHVLQGGAPVAGSPFDLTAPSPTACTAGRAYEITRQLSAAATYSYRFEASDGLAAASGVATAAKSGPVVTAVGPLVSGLTAQQLRPDAVEVRWRQAGAAAVNIEVLNQAGRTVAHVCRNVQYESGEVSAQWSRRLPSGAPAPAGTYVLVLEAVAADGARWRAMAPLPLR